MKYFTVITIAIILVTVAITSYAQAFKTDREVYRMMENWKRDNKELLLTREIKSLRDELSQKDFFYQALQEIDPTDYDRESNNCYDHSKVLQQKLLAKGIQSNIMINSARDHAWLAVWVESTNGTFKIRGINQTILEVRDENLKVVCD